MQIINAFLLSHFGSVVLLLLLIEHIVNMFNVSLEFPAKFYQLLVVLLLYPLDLLF